MRCSLCREDATELSGLCWKHDGEENARSENAEPDDDTGRCLYRDPFDGELTCVDPCEVRGIGSDGNTVTVICNDHRCEMDAAQADVHLTERIVWVAL